jgi:hypothetical protein
MSQSSFGGFVAPKPDSKGTNTGDATATAADIASGLTAYAIGVKITGTGANVKRFATGTMTSRSFTISGLLFTPSVVFGQYQRTGGTQAFEVVGLFIILPSSTMARQVTGTTDYRNFASQISPSTNFYISDSSADGQINSDGFTVEVVVPNTNNPPNGGAWYAFE